MVRETRYLLVGNLPEKVTEDTVLEHFKRWVCYGHVVGRGSHFHVSACSLVNLFYSANLLGITHFSSLIHNKFTCRGFECLQLILVVGFYIITSSSYANLHAEGMCIKLFSARAPPFFNVVFVILLGFSYS